MSRMKLALHAVLSLVSLVCTLVVSTLAVSAPAGAVGNPDPVAAQPSEFAGSVDEFYVVPDPLPPGAPGALIRVQTVRVDAVITTVRVMYHSVDAIGRDRAVTGTITYPNGPAPDGGWPVVSLANGTVGIWGGCAVSRGGGNAPTFGVTGIGVRTDYIGMGPVGEVHPYLSRLSEGRSVIDGVRAAHNLDDAHASTRWLAVGHSQGGHGALSAHELGEAWAPELDLLGTVALAPAAMFENIYGPLDAIVTQVVSVMAVYGQASEHPEIPPSDYAGPAVQAASPILFDRCLNQIVPVMAAIPPAEFWSADPRFTEPASSVMRANDVGNVAVAAPVLLIGGTADATVPIQRVRDLFTRLCGNGQVTGYSEIEGADHGTEIPMAATQIADWLNARIAGAAAADSCGTALPTTTPPPTPTSVPAPVVTPRFTA